MTPADFAALVNARLTGPSRWLARCPSHNDKGPSLSIGEGERGNVLMHCFAGCSPAEICAAVGVNLSDLFPETRPITRVLHSEPGKKWITPKDKLETLETEAFVLLVASADMAAGNPIDRDRLAQAAARIRAAMKA